MENFDSLRENARICEENIRTLCKKGNTSRELLLWLKERANAEVFLCKQDPSRIPVLPEVFSSLSLSAEDSSALLRDPAAHMNAVFVRDVIALYAGFFCEALAAQNEGWLARWYPVFGRETEGSFVYVRTPIADKAYRHFSTFVVDPKVRYASSFEEACGEVYGERADYVLLPFFGADGELIRKSLLLLEKYELHVLFSVRLYSEAEELLCEFAMAGRGLTFAKKSEKTRSIALAQYPRSEGESSALLAAIAFYDCRIRYFESGRASYDRRLCRIILEGGNTEAFLAWLLLVEPGCSLDGIYTVEETADG